MVNFESVTFVYRPDQLKDFKDLLILRPIQLNLKKDRKKNAQKYRLIVNLKNKNISIFTCHEIKKTLL